MAINKHGLTMKGLQTAASITKTLDNCYRFVQISYDLSDGRVLADSHWSVNYMLADSHVSDSWTVYHDSNIITVACAYSPKTMQEIADVIAKAVANH